MEPSTALTHGLNYWKAATKRTEGTESAGQPGSLHEIGTTKTERDKDRRNGLRRLASQPGFKSLATLHWLSTWRKVLGMSLTKDSNPDLPHPSRIQHRGASHARVAGVFPGARFAATEQPYGSSSTEESTITNGNLRRKPDRDWDSTTALGRPGSCKWRRTWTGRQGPRVPLPVTESKLAAARDAVQAAISVITFRRGSFHLEGATCTPETQCGPRFLWRGQISFDPS